MPTAEDLEREALQLDVKERARLAERLLASLDSLSAVELESLWATEAERRLAAYDRGDLEAVSSEQVLAEAEMIEG
jgi:putative addiction module component (TIGR02574 family)